MKDAKICHGRGVLYGDIAEYSVHGPNRELNDWDPVEFADYVPFHDHMQVDQLFVADVPIKTLTSILATDALHTIASYHNIGTIDPQDHPASVVKLALSTHDCSNCPRFVSFWRFKGRTPLNENIEFPPTPLSVEKTHNVITACATDLLPGKCGRARMRCMRNAHTVSKFNTVA
ncbi:hypothetical protein GALMADRAFT_142210 [Galerina marginata CBS 339.88]|uniref:Uncharacterized protein n=1 Tax=Galerina marginata (strain CBS 339.88) TaxID=685588 RepID=A0A067T1D6_GALM3|nr:hypothetical protein GALMADRAFT_142210 [Galerina marginata CBS 339.88]